MDEIVSNPPGCVGYLIKCFPRASETFILHEILELERQGVPLRIFSLLEPGTGKVPEAVAEVRAPVSYLPRRPGALLGAALRSLRRAPGRTIRTTLTAVKRSHEPWAALKHLFYATALAEQLHRAGITHLHAHYANTPTAVAQLVQQLTGVTYSFTAHAKDIYLTRPASLVERMRAARFVVTCTGYNQRYLNGLAGAALAQPAHCIYHGLDLRLFEGAEQPARRPAARPLILAVARLVEKKGLPYLLEACRLLLDRGYDFDCRIVGEGPLRTQLEQRIRELALEERVTLWGQEAHERVIAMYREACVVALPCVVAEDGDRDGIPNALVEAMSMGVPVVSTPISGVPELISDEENGLLVPPGDGAALAGALARLLDDGALREQLAKAGRRKVLAEFDMAHNATRLRTLLEQALTTAGEDIVQVRPLTRAGVALRATLE